MLNSEIVISAEQPVAAPIREAVENYHGTQISDPYRYFEDLKNPQVQDWIRAQADYTNRVLQSNPGRARLLARIRETDEAAPFRVFNVEQHPGGDLYYFKNLATENLAKLYIRDRNGAEQLLIDPARFAKSSDEHHTLGFFVPSPSGKLLIYGTAASGSEQTILRALDVATATDLPIEIDRLESAYTLPQWLHDSQGFVYSRRRKLEADDPATEGYKGTKSFIHYLGSDPESDRVLFAKDFSPDVELTEVDFPSVVIPAGSKYVIGQIKHGDATQLTLYATPLESLTSQRPGWKKVCDASDGVTDFAVGPDSIYLLTSKDAPRFRVLKTSLEQPDFAAAEVIVPEAQAVVRSLAAARDALYVGRLEAGSERLLRVPYDSPSQACELELPNGANAAQISSASLELDGAIAVTASWTRASSICRVEAGTGKLIDLGLQPRGKFDDPDDLESTLVFAPSHDGVKVPLTIISKRGLPRDGLRPTFLTGYGSYGSSRSPRFDPMNLAWLERGGVLAVAHVRGGGENGEAWRVAGQKQNKPNTWKDFIACGEYLIRERYTSPSKLAGDGTSAGGILIGRAVTERPDLFAAALMNVGCLDMLRAEITMNGVPNIPEFGTVTTLDGFAGLLEMSAYHKLRDGVAYPAVLLTHGMNDPRVDPWHSAKMTARLQAATSSGKPVLMRVDYQSGHGIGSTKSQRQELLADKLTFLLWQMGEPDFQPSFDSAQAAGD